MLFPSFAGLGERCAQEKLMPAVRCSSVKIYKKNASALSFVEFGCFLCVCDLSVASPVPTLIFEISAPLQRWCFLSFFPARRRRSREKAGDKNQKIKSPSPPGDHRHKTVCVRRTSIGEVAAAGQGSALVFVFLLPGERETESERDLLTTSGRHNVSDAAHKPGGSEG